MRKDNEMNPIHENEIFETKDGIQMILDEKKTLKDVSLMDNPAYISDSSLSCGDIVDSKDKEHSQPKSSLPHINAFEDIQVEATNKHHADDRTGRSTLFMQVLATITMSMVHFGIGTSMGFVGISLPQLTNSTLSNDQFVISEEQAAIFASVLEFGCLVGSIIGGPIVVKFGQRIAVYCLVPVFIASWIMLTQSNVFWMLIVSRISQGIMEGILEGPSASYVGEISHSSVRGMLLGIGDLFRHLGFLYLVIVGSTKMSWRTLGLVCGITSTVLPIAMFLFPNSPRWLATKERVYEAENSLRFFRGKNYNVKGELKGITEGLNQSKKRRSVLGQFMLLKDWCLAKRFLVMSFFIFGTSFTGNLALIIYSVKIFSLTSTDIDPYFSAILMCICRLVGVSIYLAIADRFPRRMLYIVPCIYRGLCMAYMCAFFYFRKYLETLQYISWLPTIMLITFQLSFCMSAPVVQALRTEIFPNSFRSLGVSLICIVFYIGTSACAYTIPMTISALGLPFLFGMYCIVNFTMALVYYVCIPETKGKSLEEIEILFHKSQSKINKDIGRP